MPGPCGVPSVEPLVQVGLEFIEQALAWSRLGQQVVDAFGSKEASSGTSVQAKLTAERGDQMAACTHCLNRGVTLTGRGHQTPLDHSRIGGRAVSPATLRPARRSAIDRCALARSGRSSSRCLVTVLSHGLTEVLPQVTAVGDPHRMRGRRGPPRRRHRQGSMLSDVDDDRPVQVRAGEDEIIDPRRGHLAGNQGSRVRRDADRTTRRPVGRGDAGRPVERCPGTALLRQ